MRQSRLTGHRGPASVSRSSLLAAGLVLAAACTGELGEGGAGEPLAGQGAAGALEAGVPTGLGDGSGGQGGAGPACTASGPTRPMLRRLSRWEYDHSVQDLLGVASSPGRGFVADTAVEGFDNQAEALVVTPLLADQLRGAAEALVGQLGEAGLQRLLPCELAAGDAGCARDFVAQFGKRAFRRPLTTLELGRYDALYAVGAADGGFRAGIELLLATLLQSPNFLYRAELGREGADGRRALDAYEIASELSYLVTGSTPDEALLAAADADALGSAAEREAQVQRLLATARGQRQLVRFVNAWLELDRLDSVPKDAATFTGFDAELRASMAGEVEHLVGHVVQRGSGTLRELLSAPLAFADPVLAAHYGLEPPQDTGFARYDAPDPARHGLLTLAAVMTTHARPDGTSPVHRGKLVRERVLCQKLAPPPPGLVVQPPAVDPTLTTRERYRAHSAEQPCLGCHRLIDPIGLAFEHLDAVGRYRQQEAGQPIDASGEIVDSAATDGRFEGTAELAALLADSPEVADCLVLQWFRFAYGTEPSGDAACLLGELQERFRADGGSVQALVRALANSVQITTRLGAAADPTEPGAGGPAEPGPADAGHAEPEPAPASDAGAGELEVRVSTDSSWQGGRCDSVSVHNTGADAVQWAVTLSLDGTLTDHWNSEADGSSAQVSFRGADHNRTLTAGATTTFGYCLAF